MKKKDIEVLNKVNYLKNHKNQASVYSEIEKISNYLKTIGYFSNSIDSISKNDNLYTANFSLGKKIEKAVILISNNFKIENKIYDIKNDSLYIDINKISGFLDFISKNLDDDGKSFSEVSLKNIRIYNNYLIAHLSIAESKERNIDKVIIKPYSKFPSSFLKHYFNIKKTTLFNEQKLKEISEDTKTLKFASEIKSPEVLFTKDSTLLYMYLQKQQNNSFDGLINFATKDNGGILFNGHIDLKLNNILNTGESFSLFWNSIAEEVQDFKISTKIPYLFSTPLSAEFDFNIYKQDSTFLNTNFKSSISYTVNPRTNLSISYSSENSNKLAENNSNEILNYDSNFIGLGFDYSKKNQNQLFENLFNINLGIEKGFRKTDIDETDQIRLRLNSSYIFQLNSRNSVYVNNESAFLNSSSLLNNELFRVGGANSIRGFNEQSIFTSKYTFFNTEYRYLTSSTSYLFSITDLGSFLINKENNFLFGVGFGYRFASNNNIFKISYALGKNHREDFNVNKSKVIVNWAVKF